MFTNETILWTYKITHLFWGESSCNSFCLIPAEVPCVGILGNTLIGPFIIEDRNKRWKLHEFHSRCGYIDVGWYDSKVMMSMVWTRRSSSTFHTSSTPKMVRSLFSRSMDWKRWSRCLASQIPRSNTIGLRSLGLHEGESVKNGENKQRGARCKD